MKIIEADSCDRIALHFATTCAAFETALGALSQGDLTGFAVVVYWLRRLSVPARNRLDVAHDVIVRALRSWRNFDPNHGRISNDATATAPEPLVFARWLNRITVRSAAEYHRAEVRRQEALLSGRMAHVEIALPDAGLIRQAVRCELAAALLCLPAAYRRAALQRVERLARRSGTPAPTIYKMRANGRGAVRTILVLNNPIVARLGRIAQIREAQRLLRKYGLPEDDVRLLLDRAEVTSHPASLLTLSRRAKRLGVSGEAHGPLHVAAQAMTHGARSRALMELAVDAAAAALFVLARPFRAPRLP